MMNRLCALFLSFLYIGLASAEANELVVQVVDDRGNPIPEAVVTFSPDTPIGSEDTTNSKLSINQKNLEFTPFITLAPMGSEIRFKNEDTVLHHVFSFSKTKKFDLKLFGKDEPQSIDIDKTGIISIGCNIHDGMVAYIFVPLAPFAAQTDESGTISLKGIPEGQGVLSVWHPLMKAKKKRKQQTVSIQAEKTELIVESKFRKRNRNSSNFSDY